MMTPAIAETLGIVASRNFQLAEDEEKLAMAVRQARDAAASWAQIGGAVGITKHEAEERWGLWVVRLGPAADQ